MIHIEIDGSGYWNGDKVKIVEYDYDDAFVKLEILEGHHKGERLELARENILSADGVRASLALKFCLKTLKAHHTTRPGITRLVEKTESMIQLDRTNARKRAARE